MANFSVRIHCEEGRKKREPNNTKGLLQVVPHTKKPTQIIIRPKKEEKQERNRGRSHRDPIEITLRWRFNDQPKYLYISILNERPLMAIWRGIDLTKISML